MIEYIINLFPGEKDISFICNDKHLKETRMIDILNRICPHGKIYEISINDNKGPVYAVSLMNDIYDNIKDENEIIISYCDFCAIWDYKNFLKNIRFNKSDGVIVCYKKFHPHMLGIDNYAFLKETEIGSKIMDEIREKKPFTNDRMNEYASCGIYYFKSGNIVKKYFKKLIELGETVNGEFYVSMVYNLFVEDGLKINIYEIEYMLQWGTPYDLENYLKWSKYFSNIHNNHNINFIDKYDTTTILPLAGKGSRFLEQGYTIPKPLLCIDNFPMVVLAIKCLPQSTNNIFICLNEHINNYLLKKNILDAYPNAEIYGIDYITGGQACTVEIGINNSKLNLDKAILITACDNGVYFNMKKYQSLVDDISNDIIVWSFKNEFTSKNNPNMYAWLETDNNDNVLSVSCKKFIEGIHDIKNSHVIIGTMFFRKAQYFIDGLYKNYNENIKTNDEYYVDDVLNQNIKNGLKIKAFQVENYICWGTPNDYKTYLYWEKFFSTCL